MILGFSYRYWDDNLSDAPNATPNCHPTSAVRVDGERAVLAETGDEVKARWVPLGDVRWSDDRTPMHPTIAGLVLEEVVEKMSKSRGNVINPDDVVAEHGADAMRLYEMFIGPLEKAAPWSTDGISGVYRFLQRAFRLIVDDEGDVDHTRPLVDGATTREQQRLIAETIVGVTEDIEHLSFNTAISKLMVFARDVTKDAALPRALADAFVLLLSPFAPHLAEELWQRLGHGETLAYETWPVADPAGLTRDEITLAVQVNGKRRDEIVVAADADESTVRDVALALASVQRHLEGRTPRKVIVVPGRLVSIVV
jgi:leucyl-tRNA synthetase